METLAASFFLGLASAASPCLLPLYPAFLALLATRRGDPSRIGTGLLGLAVILGVVTALIVVAAVVTAISIATPPRHRAAGGCPVDRGRVRRTAPDRCRVRSVTVGGHTGQGTTLLDPSGADQCEEGGDV